MVVVVVGILTVFSIATLSSADPELLAFSGYPPFADIVSSVALTFFAFLGFGVITAKHLADPERQLPRAVYLALAIPTTRLMRLVCSGVRHGALLGTRAGIREEFPEQPDEGVGPLHCRDVAAAAEDIQADVGEVRE